MVKKNYKIIIGIVIGIIVSSIGVYAASLSSSEVTYDNKVSGIQSENLQGAIDELYEKSKTPNVDLSTLPNIISVYEYNQEAENDNYCVTGDEDTCKLSNCYKTKTENSCLPGTIVNYKVNNSKIVRFHVLHDDGETMTLQSQKHTINSVAWSSSNDNRNGPIIALEAIEKETSNWTNVNEIEYTAGETVLYENKFTGCSHSSSDYRIYCNQNGYTLPKRKARARMITGQEIESVGCRVYNDKGTSYNSCLKFIGANEENSYWTMSANISGDNSTAWRVNTSYISGGPVTESNGVRAVVVISK